MKSVNPGVDLNQLLGVSCPSANNCFAVGAFYTFGVHQPLSQSLIEHWSGTSWTRVTSAEPAQARATVLDSVSCSSPTSCVAVGHSAPGSGGWSTVVKTFAGTTWSLIASPNAESASNSYLDSVSCSSATTCFAVGKSGPGGSFFHTLVESYA